jgi:hypothetical protein
MAIQVKHCSRCEADRPESDFSPRTRSADGLQPWCRECVAAYNREWRKRRKEDSK